MRRPLAMLGSAGLALACVILGAVPHADPAPQPTWRLVWSDEFDGTAIDTARWGFDTGNGYYHREAKAWVAGWGNDELQTYTSRPENARVEGGSLRIRAREEPREGFRYTSARLKTRGPEDKPLFAQAYGRFEFRARLPTGRGLWPALWMLPRDEAYGGWAASGEIDVAEARGQEPGKVEGTIHFGAPWPGTSTPAAPTSCPTAARSPSSTSMPWSGSPASSAGTWTIASLRPRTPGGVGANRETTRGRRPSIGRSPSS